MRIIQQLCAAGVLTLVITISTFAGVMQTPGETVSEQTQTSCATTAGDMHDPGQTSTGEILLPGATDDSIMEIALGFLLDVSSLL